MNLPREGAPKDVVQNEVREALSGDADWRGGKTWSLVYFAGDDVAEVLRDAYSASIFTNGLGPGAFKSLRKFESEVIGMTAGLLGMPDAVGNMTSGGTESILMAVKTARDYARAEKGITEPEMVLPITAHPAFDKAAQYLGLKLVHIGLTEDLRADVAEMRAAVTPNTVLVVGSAPNYPFGTIDSITEIAAIAQERGIPCHVDACVGGYLLPFVERLGYDVPAWDFRVQGVSSISADCHKYGYAARGASTVTYRDPAYRRYQFFAKADWPGGLYGSPTMTGSRPGGAIAAAWAVMNYLGDAGYMRLAGTIMETVATLRAGVESIEGLQILGDPPMSLVAYGSDTLDVYAVADALDAKGWHTDRQQLPPSLHHMVTPAHAEVMPQFIEDLREAVRKVAAGEQEPGGRAAMYGMLDKMPDKGAVRDILVQSIEKMNARVESRP